MLNDTLHVIVADDSRFSRYQVINLIQGIDKDIHIITASNGVEALKIMETEPVDIAILDIVMPEMTGIEVLEKLAENQELSDITPLMFTSLTDKLTLKQCFDLGATEFIAKPLDLTEFSVRFKSITKLKRNELKNKENQKVLEKQNSDLRKLNIMLGDAKAKMVHQEKLAGIGHLAAGVAHEINNPLGFIMSNFEVLSEYFSRYNQLLSSYEVLEETLEECNSENVINLLKTISLHKTELKIEYIAEDAMDIFEDSFEGLHRIKKIVSGLKNFSRIDALQEYEPYCINKGIEDTLIIMGNELKYSSDVEFIKGNVPEIHAIGGEINQVLLNLLINANDAIQEKYGGEKRGSIRIETCQDEDLVQVIIKDDGNGIPEEKMNQIFNPFFTTKPVGVGTGLGLSIAYDVIQTKHKGTIEVGSRPGEGTWFIIRLPIGQANELPDESNS